MQRAEQINPTHGEVLRIKILDAYQDKRIADCVALHKLNPKLIGLGPAKQTEIRLIVALCMHHMGNTDQGRELLKTVLASSAKGPRDLALIADFYREAGDYVLSEKYAIEAVRTAPVVSAGYRALAEVQVASGKLEDAIETLKLRLATIGPDKACEAWMSRLSHRHLAQGELVQPQAPLPPPGH
jgi:tetratricopeptide (TPR) repeat protein